MKFAFNAIDRQQTWFKRLQDSLTERLQELRERNDKRKDAEDTAELRGRIAEIKELLGCMAEPAATQAPQRRRNY